MIGSFITRGLLLIFGYTYPAYECYKTVELNRPDIEQLQFWCQYWILVAGLTVCERIGDAFIGWLPMYGEAKLAFFIYLWFPKTKGTTYIYSSFFRPYVAKHETQIDRNLLEWRTRAGDMAVLYWQRTASYGHTRIFEILQYIAAQSPPSQPAQRSAVATLDGQLPSPASTASSSEKHEGTSTEVGPAEDSKAATISAAKNEQKTVPTPSSESSKRSRTHENQVMEIEMQPSSGSPQPPESPQPPVQDTIMDEGMRVTRARSRKTRAHNLLYKT